MAKILLVLALLSFVSTKRPLPRSRDTPPSEASQKRSSSRTRDAEPTITNAPNLEIEAAAEPSVEQVNKETPASTSTSMPPTTQMPSDEAVQTKSESQSSSHNVETHNPSDKTPSIDIVQMHFEFIEDLCRITVNKVVPIYYFIQTNKVYSYVFLSILYLIILNKVMWVFFSLFRRKKAQATDNSSQIVQSQILSLKSHIDEKLESLKSFDTQFLKEERRQTEEFMDFFEKNVTDVWKEIGQIKQKLNENEVNTLSNTNSFANELKQTMEDEFERPELNEKLRERPTQVKETKAEIAEPKSNNLLKPKAKPLLSGSNISPEKPKIGRPILARQIPAPKIPIPPMVAQTNDDPALDDAQIEEPVEEILKNYDNLQDDQDFDGNIIAHDMIESEKPDLDGFTNLLNDAEYVKESEEKTKERQGPINPFSLGKPKEPMPETIPQNIPEPSQELVQENMQEEQEEIKPVLPKFKQPLKPVIGKFKRPAIPLVKPLPNLENK